MTKYYIVQVQPMIVFINKHYLLYHMSAWQEKAKTANQKVLEAIELVTSLASKSSTEEQKKTMAEAFKKYQEAWSESLEAFNEGVKEYSETQFEAYTKLFEETQKTVTEAFRKFSDVWKT